MAKKLPQWFKKKLPPDKDRKKTRELLKSLNLKTVCQEAHCPNIGECFSKKTATFMILGKTCTRNCKFCAVIHGKGEKVDPTEPLNIAKAVEKLKLKHVVITSVTRDDLKDGGVGQFISTIKEINKLNSNIIIEILTPDFKGDKIILRKLVEANFDIFNHNIETVPSLYNKVRPEANYKQSLSVLYLIKKLKPNILTKSGIMVGLGEKKSEVIEVLKDLRESNCDMLTIGQYLQPSQNHVKINEFVTLKQFAEYKKNAEDLGFKAVSSGPFVRSSYKSNELYIECLK